ncbi:MAG: enolase C-terminal domain-like protein, partial [Candidatus Bathyarchaeia archaeon]
IAPSRLVGMEVENHKRIDSTIHELDPTKDLSVIGGNTAYAISVASANAGASSRSIPLFRYLSDHGDFRLPYPLGNVIGGGLHARGERTDIQEFLSLPTSSRSFAEAAAANIKVHKEVARLIEKKGIKIAGRGDEGAWIAPLSSEDGLEVLCKACSEIEDQTGVKLRAGVDIAASTLWQEKSESYHYPRDGRRLDGGEQLEFVLELIRRYRLAYVEDPFHEESFDSFTELTKKARNTLICGDDLFTTSVKRLERGIKVGAANAVIIKPNQVGTLTDAIAATNLAKDAGYVPVVSHRSGETCGHEISHLAVAVQAPLIKLGVVGGERIAKINELIRIEESLGEEAKMAEIRI